MLVTHNRRSTRLPDYDYAQAGAYFVTVCVKARECALGEMVDEDMHLSQEGEIVQSVWDELPQHYAHIEIGEFVIMPNHVHAIVWITEEMKNKVSSTKNVRAGLKPAPTKSVKRHGLPEIVRGFKTFSARRINKMNNTTGTPFWQRGYHEHVIRNDRDLRTHREYIQNNPIKWMLDEYYRDMEQSIK